MGDCMTPQAQKSRGSASTYNARHGVELPRFVPTVRYGRRDRGHLGSDQLNTAAIEPCTQSESCPVVVASLTATAVPRADDHSSSSYGGVNRQLQATDGSRHLDTHIEGLLSL